jgi:hypothetical protein
MFGVSKEEGPWRAQTLAGGWPYRIERRGNRPRARLTRRAVE